VCFSPDSGGIPDIPKPLLGPTTDIGATGFLSETCIVGTAFRNSSSLAQYQYFN
jgi:hypothetical protein